MSTLGAAASLRHAMPEIALAVGALGALAWDLLAKGKARVAGSATIGLVALACSGVSCVRFLAHDWDAMLLFDGQLALDRFACTFRLVFAVATALVLVAAIPSREARSTRGGAELVALMLTVCLGMNVMAMSRTLLTMYLGLEIVSVISFVLAGYKTGDGKSAEAALKYAIFGGVASGSMLYGMSWLYGLTRSIVLPEIAERVIAMTHDQGHLPNAVAVGVAGVVAGFAYKIAAAPFHAWAPDVYEGSPTLVAAFLSVGPKAAGLAVLVRFFHDALKAHSVATGAHGAPWPIVVGTLAALTMTVGNLSALAQTNLKRLLAYSSIAHAGTMLLAFAVFSDAGVAAVAFYLVVYVLMNLGAFVVVHAVAERNGGDETLAGVRGLAERAPGMAAAMAVFLFSLVGLPPFAGFVGKLYVLVALLGAGGPFSGFYAALAGIAVVNTVVSLFYCARVLAAMYLAPKPEVVAPALHVRRLYGLLAAGLAVPTVVLGVWWSPVYDFITRSTTMLP